MDANSNYALATALKQAGVKIKAAIYATGYEPDVIKSPAWKTLQGGYFLSLFRPWSLPNAGTQQMQAAMEKYAHFTKTDFPNFGQYESWAGADLMIKGLQMAGANPTRAAVIKDLREHQVLQRQRPASGQPELRHELRAQPAQDLCLDHEGRAERASRRSRRSPRAAPTFPGRRRPVRPRPAHRTMESEPPACTACRRFARSGPQRSRHSGRGA